MSHRRLPIPAATPVTCALHEAQILGALRIAVAQAPSPTRHVHHAAVADTGDVPVFCQLAMMAVWSSVP